MLNVNRLIVFISFVMYALNRLIKLRKLTLGQN